MSTFTRVVRIGPGTLCALILIRSLDGPVAHAQRGQGSSLVSDASPRGGPPGAGDERGPPPFAYAACADKARGDDCKVSFADRTLEGSCVTGLDDKLFCLPGDVLPAPPGDGQGQPPR